MRRLSRNPFILFLPFLFIYICIVLLGHKDAMEGDEGRYVQYAQNLLNGYYSPPGEVYLWNGPGYPIILMPFMVMKLPLICSALMNAFFQYLSVVYLFKALRILVKPNLAVFFSIVWGCFYIVFKEMCWLYTESLSNMLVSMFLFYALLAFSEDKKSRAHIWIAAFLLGYLTLTKIIFGYVLLVSIPTLTVLYLFRRISSIKRALLIVLAAMLFNLPYLAYTHHLTGKYFYWANSGGMSLYWASTPVKGEFGDWNDDFFKAYCGIDDVQPCNDSLFAANHKLDYDTIYRYQGIARDEAFRKAGIRNIMHYPLKYFKNCIANAGRFFFGIPYSYSFQRMQTLARIPPGAVAFLLLLFSIGMTMVNFRRIGFEIFFVAGFFALYFAASIAVSTNQRQLELAVPMIILWAAFFVDRCISFRLLLPKGGQVFSKGRDTDR